MPGVSPSESQNPTNPALTTGDLSSVLAKAQLAGKEFRQSTSNQREIENYKERALVVDLDTYTELVRAQPAIARNAFQRTYDMLLSYGSYEIGEGRDLKTRQRIWDDPMGGGKNAIFGIDTTLETIVGVLKSAAHGYGTNKRVLLLHGPVGSSKSTIAALLKRGLEEYSKKPEGALFALGWKGEDGQTTWCPMNEEPLNAIPESRREKYEKRVNENNTSYPVKVGCDLCPSCQQTYRELEQKYNGDFDKIAEHIEVKRLTISEKDRVGIGTFQPKDEKNQDSTELSGDVNYRKIAKYGSDSDPRAFNFDGEFNVANRGIVEFVEVLKLEVAFLYDLLGASQEHKIKPKKFPQIDIDEVILGHTNEPEYKKLQGNEFMEALRDRTVKVDVPYITKLSDEMKIYQRDYSKTGKHIAPHTIEMAAMWAVLTRLEEPKNASLSLMQKLKLYNGKSLPGFTQDNIAELKASATNEGFSGISPRYIQDKIGNVLVRPDAKSINPFMLLNELETGLANHSLINDPAVKEKYRKLLGLVKNEYEDIVKNEVQRAIAADEDAMKRLCGNYIDNVKAYTQREKVKNKFTGSYESPDERLMRSIEEKIEIPESRKDDFRREIMNYIGALSIDGKTFDYRTNERLHKALELKLFEDQKDSIKITSLVSKVVDEDTQAKIDVVKSRLIRDFGYDDESATDVLNYVASIYARGTTTSR